MRQILMTDDGNDGIWKFISTIAVQASEYGNTLTGLTSYSAEAEPAAKHTITGRSHALESSEVTLLRGLYQEAKHHWWRLASIARHLPLSAIAVGSRYVD
jgi:hypothetical protein